MQSFIVIHKLSVKYYRMSYKLNPNYILIVNIIAKGIRKYVMFCKYFVIQVQTRFFFQFDAKSSIFLLFCIKIQKNLEKKS